MVILFGINFLCHTLCCCRYLKPIFFNDVIQKFSSYRTNQSITFYFFNKPLGSIFLFISKKHLWNQTSPDFQYFHYNFYQFIYQTVHSRYNIKCPFCYMCCQRIPDTFA